MKVGETISATVRVEDVREDSSICKLKTIVRNADGDECVVGSATTYTTPLLGGANDILPRDNQGCGRRCRPDQSTYELSGGLGRHPPFSPMELPTKSNTVRLIACSRYT